MSTKYFPLRMTRSRSSGTGVLHMLSRSVYLLTPCSPDLHSPPATANLAALLVAPINSYQSVLTLLALQQYAPLLALQPFSTRRSLAHALISSVLKNETVIEASEDVNGILELCHVLIRDQTDSGNAPAVPKESRRGVYHPTEREEMAEEQGWIARMVHLFRAESLDVQFEVCRMQFSLTIIHIDPEFLIAAANCASAF